MLIRREPNIYEKLHHLAGIATDDSLDDAPLSKASASYVMASSPWPSSSASRPSL